MPDFPGKDLGGVFTLRSLDDADEWARVVAAGTAHIARFSWDRSAWALLDAVAAWGRARSLTTVVGPMSPGGTDGPDTTHAGRPGCRSASRR